MPHKDDIKVEVEVDKGAPGPSTPSYVVPPIEASMRQQTPEEIQSNAARGGRGSATSAPDGVYAAWGRPTRRLTGLTPTEIGHLGA